MKKSTFTLFLVLTLVLNSSCDIPETYIYLGNQVPENYIKQLKELELLNNTEKIKYFYSDGFTDLKEGIYFVTDQHLVLYNKEWEKPDMIIKFEDILSLDFEYDKSFLNDSLIKLTTTEYEIEFPVSSEKGRDKDFFKYLLKKTKLIKAPE